MTNTDTNTEVANPRVTLTYALELHSKVQRLVLTGSALTYEHLDVSEAMAAASEVLELADSGSFIFLYTTLIMVWLETAEATRQALERVPVKEPERGESD